jgi:hypothetical protein
MPAIKMLHGFAVKNFDWQAHGTRAPIAPMWGATTKLVDAISTALAKAQEIDQSKDFTVSGRASAKREWVKTNAAATIKEAVNAMQMANAEIGKIKSKMTPRDIDKSDIAGALRRQEIRGWLRSLPDARRNAMLIMTDQLEPEIAAAIVESPPELSGVSSEQRARLTERAMALQYPREAENISNINAAAEALGDHIRMASEVLRKNLGVSDVYEIAGLTPTLGEKLAAILAPAAEDAA